MKHLVLVLATVIVVALAGVGVVLASAGAAPDAPGAPGTPAPGTPPPSAAPSPVDPVPNPRVFDVTIETGTAADITARITDRSGTLVRAASGPARDGGSVPEGVLVEQVDPTTLRLTWTDLVCSIAYEIDVDATGRSIAIDAPACSGDAYALDRVLDLTFDGPVDAADVTATLSVG